MVTGAGGRRLAPPRAGPRRGCGSSGRRSLPEAAGQGEPGEPAVERPVAVAGLGQRLDRLGRQGQPARPGAVEHEPPAGGEPRRIDPDGQAPDQAVDQPRRPARPTTGPARHAPRPPPRPRPRRGRRACAPARQGQRGPLQGVQVLEHEQVEPAEPLAELGPAARPGPAASAQAAANASASRCATADPGRRSRHSATRPARSRDLPTPDGPCTTSGESPSPRPAPRQGQHARLRQRVLRPRHEPVPGMRVGAMAGLGAGVEARPRSASIRRLVLGHRSHPRAQIPGLGRTVRVCSRPSRRMTTATSRSGATPAAAA